MLRYSPPSIFEITSKLLTLPPTDALQYLDDSLDEARRYVIDLSKSRNSLAKINSLPAEILALILVECITPAPIDFFHIVGWAQRVSYTMVCARWRDIALRCPRFWSGVPLLPNQHLVEMINRSAQVPIPVRLKLEDWNHSLVQESQPQILDLQRVSEFHVTGSDTRFHDEDEGQLLDQVMEYLHLGISHPELRSIVMHEKNCPISLPSSILHSPLPSLVRLYVIDCAVPWDFLEEQECSFPELTELALISPTVTCSSESLLRFMGSAAKLKQLSLRNTMTEAHPDHPKSVTTSKTPLVLEHWEYFSISDNLLNCANFRTSIIFSHDNEILDKALITVTRDHHCYSRTEIDDILGELVRVLVASSAEVDNHGNNFYMDLHLECQEPFDERLWMSFPDRGLYLILPNLQTNSNFFNSIKLPHIQLLQVKQEGVNVFPSRYYLEWCWFLKKSSFSYISIYGGDASLAIGALGRGPLVLEEDEDALAVGFLPTTRHEFVLGSSNAADSIPPPPFFFPDLNIATLGDMDFPPEAQHLEHLISVLQDRSAHNCELPELELENIAYFNEKDFEKLQEAFPGLKIRWKKERRDVRY